MGNQIYKEISNFAEMQRDEIKREKAKKKRKSVCIDPDSVIGKEIMYQTALLHEILDEIRGERKRTMNDFYSKLRQRLYSDAKVVNYYAKEKDLGRNHDNYGACIALAGVLKELGHPTSVAVYENDEGYLLVPTIEIDGVKIVV